MLLKNYKDLIAMGKEKLNEALAVPRAWEQRKRAELEIAKIDSELAVKQQQIQEIAAGYPINFDRLIDSIDELALLERRQEQFKKIVAEMFPDTEAPKS